MNKELTTRDAAALCTLVPLVPRTVNPKVPTKPEAGVVTVRVVLETEPLTGTVTVDAGLNEGVVPAGSPTADRATGPPNPKIPVTVTLYEAAKPACTDTVAGETLMVKSGGEMTAWNVGDALPAVARKPGSNLMLLPAWKVTLELPLTMTVPLVVIVLLA